MATASRKLMVTIGLDGDKVVIKGVKEVDAAIDKAGKTGSGAFGKVKDTMQGIVGPASEVISALKDIGEVGAYFFDLALQFSETGSKIHDLGQQADLTAETISVMKAAAEGGGSSLEEVGPKLAKFTAALATAANGNKELSAALGRFGIDAKTAFQNPDQALSQFATKFNQLPPSAQKNADAMKIFKDKTGAIIPILYQIDGSFEKYKQQLDATGRIMSQDAADAADKFGDQLTELKEVAEAAGHQFAAEFAPQITGAMRDITQSLADNKGSWRNWGTYVNGLILGLRGAMGNFSEVMLAFLSMDPSGVAAAMAKGMQDATMRDIDAMLAEVAKGPKPKGSQDATGATGGVGGAKDDAYQNAIKAAKQKATAIIEAVQTETAALERQYQRQTVDLETYVQQSKALIARKAAAVREQTDAEQVAVATLNRRGYEERKQLVEAAIAADQKAQNDAAEASLALEDRTNAERLYRFRANAQRMEAISAESDQRRNAAASYSAQRWAETMAVASHIMNDAEAEAFRNRSGLEQVTFEESARLADRLAADSIERQRRQLNQEMAMVTGAADVNVAEYNRIFDALALLAEQEKSIRAEGRRDIEDGARRDHQVRSDAADAAAAHAHRLIELDDAVTASAIDSERQRLEAELRGTNAFGRARQMALAKLVVLDLKELTQKHKQNTALLDANEALLLQETASEEERLRIKQRYRQLRSEEDDRYNQSIKDRTNSGNKEVNDSGNLGAFTSGMASGQIAELTNGIQNFGDVAATAFNVAGAAAGQFASAIGGLVSNWVLMGTAGPDAMRKMVASVLAGIASQSAVYAVFELARGFANLFWNPPEAAAHFHAAALFGGLAIGTGVGGRKAAGNLFSADGGSAAGSAPDYSQFGQASYAGNQSIRTDRMVPPPSSRLESILGRVADALEPFETASAGDVVQRGIKQKRGLIGETVEKELSNRTLANNVGRKLGFV